MTRRTWTSGTNLPGTVVSNKKNRKVVLIYLGLFLVTRRTWTSGTNLPGTVASDKKNMDKWY